MTDISLRRGVIGTSNVADHIAIRISYAWRHRRMPDLKNAPRFTEMVQRRKLFDRDARHHLLMDKIAAKAIVADQLGAEWVTPTLWQGKTLSSQPSFLFPAILKARHGCNQYAVLKHELCADEWADLTRKALGWVKRPYGTWLSEWAYQHVPRGLLAEPLLGNGNELPVDYKIYVFGGVAVCIQVHMDRNGRHRWTLYDRDYRPLHPSVDAPPRPLALSEMLRAAESLAAGYDFLRVDFYEIEGKPRFGEFCLYPGSGLDPFATSQIDLQLGRWWHSVLRRPVDPLPSDE